MTSTTAQDFHNELLQKEIVKKAYTFDDLKKLLDLIISNKLAELKTSTVVKFDWNADLKSVGCVMLGKFQLPYEHKSVIHAISKEYRSRGFDISQVGWASSTVEGEHSPEILIFLNKF